jgi:hypothetical protein
LSIHLYGKLLLLNIAPRNGLHCICRYGQQYLTQVRSSIGKFESNRIGPAALDGIAEWRAAARIHPLSDCFRRAEPEWAGNSRYSTFQVTPSPSPASPAASLLPFPFNNSGSPTIARQYRKPLMVPPPHPTASKQTSIPALDLSKHRIRSPHGSSDNARSQECQMSLTTKTITCHRLLKSLFNSPIRSILTMNKMKVGCTVLLQLLTVAFLTCDAASREGYLFDEFGTQLLLRIRTQLQLCAGGVLICERSVLQPLIRQYEVLCKIFEDRRSVIGFATEL